jgi:hypothetical protein
MSEVFLRFQVFTARAAEWLSTRPSLSAQFYDILHRFQRCPKNPRMAFMSLRRLLSDSPDLLAGMETLSAAFPHPSTLEPDFCDFMQTICERAQSPGIGLVVGEAISYHTEGFVGLPFLHHYLNLLLAGLDPDLQNQIHWAADEMALRIRISRIVPLTRDDCPRMCSLPISIDLSPMLSIPPQLQFLSMVNLIVPSKTNVTSIMKCLKLFGNQMISIEEAIEWIGHFDGSLKSFFQSMVLECEPASLSPSKLKSAADKQVKSKSQQLWAFGPTIIDILSTQSVGQRELGSEGRISIEVRDQRVDLIPSSILELQTRSFHQQLKFAAVQLQKQKPVEIKAEVQNAIYGGHGKFPSNKSATAVVLQRLFKVGRKALDAQFRYINSVMAQLAPNTTEWRTEYSRLLGPVFARRILNLSGLQGRFPEHIDLILDLFLRFVRRFASISPSFPAQFAAAFRNGLTYMGERSALSIYYFFAAAHLIEAAADVVKWQLIAQIPDLVFDVAAPLPVFGDEMVANVDIPLLAAVKMMKRVPSAVFVSEDVSVILNEPADQFFYEMAVENGAFTIVAAINPRVDFTSGPPPPQPEPEQEGVTDAEEETEKEEPDSSVNDES